LSCGTSIVLDEKLPSHGNDKLVPPHPILVGHLATTVEAKVRKDIEERVLREANFDGQVREAIEPGTMPAMSQLDWLISKTQTQCCGSAL